MQSIEINQNFYFVVQRKSKMVTSYISIDKIDAKDYMPFDLKVSDEAAATFDKRSGHRKQRIFHLKCKRYNPESDTFEISNARVLNYSANGLYFEATNHFEPRDPVCLLMGDQPSDTCDSEFSKGVHAQIVWCKLLNSGGDQKYGVGVRYFEPIKTSEGG